MKECLFCKEEIAESRNSRAIYCSDTCKTKYHRKKHGMPEPFKKRNVTNTPEYYGSCFCDENHLERNFKGFRCVRCNAEWIKKA